MESSLAVKVIYDDTTPGQIVKWKVEEGRRVSQNTVLFEYKNNKLNKLKSKFAGTVKKILMKENDSVQYGNVVAVLEKCPHTTLWRNICADCGSEIEKDENISPTFVAMEHCVPDLLVSEKNALELGRKDKHRLLQGRKLVLLVDLDQTVIHTTNDDIPPTLKDVYHFQLQHGRDNRQWWYHTKLRPYTKEFLQNVSKYYELHICTFGVRSYAHAIANFLDPEKKYFQHRILSRDECFHPNLKTLNLTNLFPCGDSMVCIIDDREDVWKSARNMIRVKPYSFFEGSADINAPPQAAKSANSRVEKEKVARKQTVVRVPVKKSTSKKEKDDKQIKDDEEREEKVDKENQCDGVKEYSREDSRNADNNPAEEFVEIVEWEDNDDYLLYLEHILIRIHTSFYNQYDKNNDTLDSCQLDLKDILPKEKKRVLQGCNILFSGVIPLKQTLETSWAYRLATSFGANIHTELIFGGGPNGTTHVVGMRDGTEKIKKAYKHKIFVVNIDWLLDSVERWEKVEELLYNVSKPPSLKYMLYCASSNFEYPVEVLKPPKDIRLPDEGLLPGGDKAKWMAEIIGFFESNAIDSELIEDSDDESDDEKKSLKKRSAESDVDSNEEFNDLEENAGCAKRRRVDAEDESSADGISCSEASVDDEEFNYNHSEGDDE